MATSLIPAVNAPAVTLTEDERTSLSWPERAAALKIVDAQTFQLADEERAGAKDLIAQAEAKHKRTCDDTYKAWQSALAHRKGELEPLLKAVELYDRSMKAWDAL